ncbi:MAG: tetratricopeptide repeat protein [Candidatus Obscuribacterales bacterium]|nr:tetratricopeptide repeat protein [Candidatus Obscuribacterales bacterium]
MSEHNRSERIIALAVVLMLCQSPSVLAKGGGPWEQHIASARDSLNFGNFAQAESDLNLAMEDTRKFKDNDVRLGETYYLMGQLNVRLQNYTLAKQYYERALNVQQKLLGPESNEAGNSLYGIAMCCQYLGDHLAAEIYLKRVEELWRKKYGATDPRLISILPAMGTYASMKNNLAQAEQYYKQLVDIEGAQGGSNPRYGDHLNLLATTLGAEGKYSEAKGYAEKAVDYLKKNSDSSIAIDAAKDNLRIVERKTSGKILGDSEQGSPDVETKVAFGPVNMTPTPIKPVGTPIVTPRSPANPIPTEQGEERSPANAIDKTPKSPANPVTPKSPANPVTQVRTPKSPVNPGEEDKAPKTPSNPIATGDGASTKSPANPKATHKATPANPVTPKSPASSSGSRDKTPANPTTPQLAMGTESSPLGRSYVRGTEEEPPVNTDPPKLATAKIGSTTPVIPQSSQPQTGSSGEPKPWQTDRVIKKNTGQDKQYGKVRYLADGKLITAEEYKALLLATEAYEMMRQEKYKMAADVLTKALDIFPELPSAHTNIGLALARLGRTDEAIDHLKTAIALDPSRSAPWVNLASSFQTSGRLKDCVETYREYLRRFPSDNLASKATELVKHLEEEVNEQQSVEKSLAVVHENTKNDYFAYTTSGGTTKWNPSHSPIKVYIGNGNKVPGYKTEYQGIMTDAFNNWTIASQDKVKFDFVSKPEGADIECIWTNDYSKVSSPAEGGEAQIQSNNNGIEHVKIVILTADPTPDSPLSQNQVKAVCLHEIGHGLGLIGHSPDPSDIMFCTMPAVDSKITISPRDMGTIRRLYSPDVHIAMGKKPGEGRASDPVNEGARLVESHAYSQAIEKLEAVLKSDPSNESAKETLSKAYNDYALDLAQKGKEKDAESVLKKAMGLQNAIKNAALRIVTFNNYASILRKMRRDKEAEQLEAEAKKLPH